MIPHESDEVIDTLICLMLENDIQCLVDVGAGDGYEAAQIARITGCRIVCYEANPDIAAKYSNVICATLGAAEDDTILYSGAQPGLSSLHDRGGKRHHVHVTTLDALCQRDGIVPDALIIDTEGTTLEVLMGAENVLPGVKVIYAEVQNQRLYIGGALADEVDAYLVARGFIQRPGLPAYSAGVQSNLTWVRP